MPGKLNPYTLFLNCTDYLIFLRIIYATSEGCSSTSYTTIHPLAPTSTKFLEAPLNINFIPTVFLTKSV